MTSSASERPDGTPSARDRENGNDIDLLIQARLRASFAEVLAEPIPEKFIRLLDRLANREKK